MEHQKPGATPSGSDYAAAGTSTVAEAALSRLGLSPALSGVAKGAGLKAMAQVPALIAKATAAEAAGGAAGDVINQVGRTAGTQDGLTVDPKEVGNVAALSGLTGGAIRTARGLSDVTNAARFSKVNEDAGARAVARMDATGIDPTNAGNAFKTVEAARRTSDVELSDAHQVIRPLQKSTGNDTETDATRTLARAALAQAKASGDIQPGQLSALRDRLGDTQEGSKFLDLLEERNALNQLTSKGRYDAGSGTFAGGVASHPVADTLLNPGRYLGAKLVGGAGALGAAELPSLAHLGLVGPALAKLAAVQAGAYGATRALDRVTGLRNPAQEFSDRFRGLQKAFGDDLPSFRQGAEDAAAEVAPQSPIGAQSGPTAQEGTRAGSDDLLRRTILSGEASRKLREATESPEAPQAPQVTAGRPPPVPSATQRQSRASRAADLRRRSSPARHEGSSSHRSSGVSRVRGCARNPTLPGNRR